MNGIIVTIDSDKQIVGIIKLLTFNYDNDTAIVVYNVGIQLGKDMYHQHPCNYTIDGEDYINLKEAIVAGTEIEFLKNIVKTKHQL